MFFPNTLRKRILMRKMIFWIVIFTTLMISSCSPAIAPSAGVQITQVTVAVGGAEGSADQQVVSYKVTMQNTTQNNVILRWIEPVLNERISGRLIDDSQRVFVDKTLKANSSLVIDGQFRFNSSSATKSEIADWEPFFKDMLVSTELELPLPSQTGK
jgi:hypothetical protein